MGERFDFNCPSCGYKAVISGDDSAGMACTTTTILCEDCRRLYDAVTSRAPWNPEYYFEPKCPKKGNHRVQRWKYPDVCPKCGAVMERGETVILWD